MCLTMVATRLHPRMLLAFVTSILCATGEPAVYNLEPMKSEGIPHNWDKRKRKNKKSISAVGKELQYTGASNLMGCFHLYLHRGAFLLDSLNAPPVSC